MSGRIYEIQHESGRISTGLSSTEVREQVAMGLIDRSAQIRISGHDRWHALAEVPDLVYPAARSAPPSKESHAVASSTSVQPEMPYALDLSATTDASVVDDCPSASEATRAGDLSGEHALTDEISEYESAHAGDDSMTSDPVSTEVDRHDFIATPIPEDRHDLVSSSVPTNTGDSMSTKFMATARKSLAILIGGYVAKHALVFASTMIAPESKAHEVLTSLPAPLAAVVAAWAGYLLVCGALEEYGDGDSEGFARSLRALAISAGVFIVLTCLIGLAGSVMTS